MLRRTLLLLPLLSPACQRAEMFRVVGFEQESFSPRADILFVLDNSDSMQEEANLLAANFTAFIRELSADREAYPTDGLSDAVSFYAASTDGRNNLVNYQIGVVTTDPVDEGRFSGTGMITRFDDEVDQDFARNLLCDAACFIESPPQGGHSCGDPLVGEPTVGWFDCECGGVPGPESCGSAQEEPLETVLLAMCRSVPNPPAACFDEAFGDFGEADVLSNGPFLRPGATMIPVIVSDEGDDSRRIDGNDPLPDAYKRLFDQFDQRMIWTYIGPDRDDSGAFRCGASPFGALRLLHMVESTGGVYTPINDLSTGCQPVAFDETLAALTQLIRSLNRSFRLGNIPDPATIAVYTSDGGAIPPAEERGLSASGVPLYGDGWSYDEPTNTVLLHGDAVPDFDEDVQVYYLPLAGNPRELPF